MHEILGESLKKLKWIRLHKQRRLAIMLVLSAVVWLNVFWGLRQPGLTLAGDADCRIREHTHNDKCYTQTLTCELPKEVHTHAESCYTTRFAEQLEQLNLVCTETEEPHEHSEDCYVLEVIEAAEEQILACELSEDAHIAGALQ